MPESRLPTRILSTDAVAERAGEVAELEQPGREDDRGGEQEREPGGVLVGEPAQQSGGHRHP